jgi:anti-sigma regulatory factor (Ser/Thr protein kinase)/PAS domain-containing protein
MAKVFDRPGAPPVRPGMFGLEPVSMSGLADRRLPVGLGAAAAALALATAVTALARKRLRRQRHGPDPAETARTYEHAVLHSVREGVLVTDGDRRLILANEEARRLLQLPPDAEGRHVSELGLAPTLAALLASEREAIDEVHSGHDRLLAVNHRPTDRAGGPPGGVATLRDATELGALSGKAELARKRLKLLYDAGAVIGTTLDVRRTAEELAEYVAPGFADFVTVDLFENVLRGEDPPTGVGEMLRTALSGVAEDHPLLKVGDLVPYGPPGMPWDLLSGEPVVIPDLSGPAWALWRKPHPERAARMIDYGLHSTISVPLRARNVVLGTTNFYRLTGRESFVPDDMSFARELVARAAVSIDNARRYTREHTMAVTLQRSLLPRGLPEQNAVDAAYRYLPAQAGVRGDWFDVIPLPGTRVALIVGDVVGHGLHAAATMGRLRTAVHNFSSLDLPPDELLSHLDELVARIDQDEAAADIGGADHDGEQGAADGGVLGATCLYAIYDPVSRRCTVASAGHPLPALVHPDGTVEFPELPVGPLLGLGGLPFEAGELELPEGSQLVLYTNGLIEGRNRDLDAGLELLRSALASAERPPEETCRVVLDVLLPPHAADDIALLVARTRGLSPDQVADWDVPSDPAAVAGMRAEATRQLAEWGLEEVEFTAELILSELITNAIRHATGPIRVRMLRDRTLICEVSDTSSTSPHLGYAAVTDEGGRGLFLVAQIAERWGTRYTAEGKVIWAELALPTREPSRLAPQFAQPTRGT